MNVLILNWRDPRHPKSGGAEKLNLQLLNPFLKARHRVTWYATAYPNLPQTETYSGINIIRRGNYVTHFLWFPWLLWTGGFGRVDLILDSVHGYGYLSPLFARSIPRRVIVCEVAQNIWNEMWPFPISLLGRIVEIINYWIYKGSQIWTISVSTKNDLTRFGIPDNQISVIPMGFDAPASLVIADKFKQPTALFVGRLCEMKGVKDAVRAISMTQDRRWQLLIIGRGEEKFEKQLKTLISNLNLESRVRFLGYVSEKVKYNYMAKSWILLVPSSREGWGMIVPESNWAGTPVLAYNVPGLQDVVPASSLQNKLLPASPKSLATELDMMSKPATLKHRPVSGWSQLLTWVTKQLPQLTQHSPH